MGQGERAIDLALDALRRADASGHPALPAIAADVQDPVAVVAVQLGGHEVADIFCERDASGRWTCRQGVVMVDDDWDTTRPEPAAADPDGPPDYVGHHRIGGHGESATDPRGWLWVSGVAATDVAAVELVTSGGTRRVAPGPDGVFLAMAPASIGEDPEVTVFTADGLAHAAGF